MPLLGFPNCRVEGEAYLLSLEQRASCLFKYRRQTLTLYRQVAWDGAQYSAVEKRRVTSGLAMIVDELSWPANACFVSAFAARVSWAVVPARPW